MVQVHLFESLLLLLATLLMTVFLTVLFFRLAAKAICKFICFAYLNDTFYRYRRKKTFSIVLQIISVQVCCVATHKKHL